MDDHLLKTTPVPGSEPAQLHTVPPQANIIAWARELTKKFGDQTAVSNLNFDVPQGVIFGFIGPSGCGKTTTIRLLTGILKPTSGEVQMFGYSPARFKRKDREKIGYMMQSFVLYPDLTVWENMNFAASIYGISIFRRKRLTQLLDFVELSEHKNKLARHLSGGMQRRLGLAATLIHHPEILFLDEPTAGIDPVLRRKIWDYFKTLQSDGYTLFVTTQYVGEAAYCDLVGVMAEGRLLMVDTPDGLRKRAYGGEVIDLHTQQPIPPGLRFTVDELPFVTRPITQLSERDLRVVVDEASTAIPRLMDWARDHQLEIESVGEFQPPFDDVLVRLVKQEEMGVHA